MDLTPPIYMKYFLDTEFIEGTQKKWFLGRETKPTIDLISIGIVAEDGREYYAISKDFNLKEAWNRYELKLASVVKVVKVYWLRENVLKSVYTDLCKLEVESINHGAIIGGRYISIDEYKHYIGIKLKNAFSYKNLNYLLNKFGKTNKQIAIEIKEFVWYDRPEYLLDRYAPKFYGYYADYDWVVFCWLFGKMINLPNGFSKYCIDLKQECDKVPDQPIKNHNSYPKQTNEHNALADARWNKALYDFLNTL